MYTNNQIIRRGVEHWQIQLINRISDLRFGKFLQPYQLICQSITRRQAGGTLWLQFMFAVNCSPTALRYWCSATRTHTHKGKHKSNLITIKTYVSYILSNPRKSSPICPDLQVPLAYSDLRLTKNVRLSEINPFLSAHKSFSCVSSNPGIQCAT